MLQKRTIKSIANYLVFLGEEEECIEIFRQLMCEQKGFESYGVFRALDTAREGFLSIPGLTEFLASQEKVFDTKFTELFFKHYDLDNDRRLTFSEFLRIVLPHENKTLRTMVTQRPTSDSLPTFDVQFALGRLLEKEINLQRKKVNLKNELFNENFDFNLKDAFNLIDPTFNGCFDFGDLKTFLRNQHCEPSDSLVIAILTRLDRNDDGVITWPEFKEAFSNIEFEPSRVSFTPSKSQDSKFRSGNCDVCRSTKRRAKPSRIELEEVSELLVSLKQIVNLEKEVDLLRRDLALAADFNLPDAFRFFAQGKEKVGPKELSQSLKHLLKPSRHEIYLLIRRFDFDGDNKLNKDEFSDVFVSRNEEFGSIMSGRKGYISLEVECIEDVFNGETLRLLKEFFILIMENEAAVEGLKQRLNSRKAFNFKNLFIHLDYDQDGFLSVLDVH